ncbi:CLUMA_CG007693, isoform A [Clunio marinus]|uniref:cathepsin L n=1 Tax=Clunio marinus TaxID=568069 RepID=A0A1J1I6X8_9DIPT|nr:CLUMA_CG007693, isoform A [Clunio marinus]
MNIKVLVRYHKNFSVSYREERHKKAFQENLDEIVKHNEAFKNGSSSFKISSNSLADLSNQQYLKHFVRLVDSDFDEATDQENIVGAGLEHGDYPSRLDWREKGFVTKPMNQKSCGSCYAFSIGHSVEGQIFKRLNRIIELSTQQIVDCSTDYGNHGCAGGSLRTTLKYLQKSGGLMREVDYPYNAKQNKCAYDPDLAIVNITSWAILPRKNENVMKAILNEVGPIAVSINASLRTFQLYSKGIYDDKDCSSNTVNHAMLLIGYDEHSWILKNWWGRKWGEKGYMRIKRGVNMCGISNYAAYAVV